MSQVWESRYTSVLAVPQCSNLQDESNCCFGHLGLSVLQWEAPEQSCTWVTWLTQGCCYQSSRCCLSHGSWAFPSPGSPSHFHRDFRSARGSASNGSGQACPVPFVEMEFNFSLSREPSAPSCPLSCSHQLENELWELSPWSRNPR